MPPVIDLTKCKGCGDCDKYCPGDIIHMKRLKGKKKIPVVVYPEECFHCGICRVECCEPGTIEYVFPPLML